MKPLPADGHWPCQRRPAADVPPHLVALLYRLMRDHLPTGVIEQILLDVKDTTEDFVYTSAHLEALARAHATVITDLRADGSLRPGSPVAQRSTARAEPLETGQP